MNKAIQWTALSGALALLSSLASAADKPQPKPKPSAAAAASTTASLFPDPVVARGKTFEIKRSQLDDAFIQLKANMAASGQGIPEAKRSDVEGRLLERLIFTQVLTNKATVADRAKAKEAADKFIAESKKRFPSDEAFLRQLKALGMTWDQFQARALEDAIAETVLDRELKGKIVISDAEVKKFYDENPKAFEQPEMVRAAHVLIATRNTETDQDLSDEQKKEKKATAEKVLLRARKGEDFAALVKEFSDDPGSKDRGGEYTFPRGRMVPEFEAAAFSLNTNQISDIVTTRFGFHIIKVSEKIPERKLEFTKVADDVRENLLRDQIQQRLPDYLDKVKKEANVEVLDRTLVLPPPAPKPDSTSQGKPVPGKAEPSKPAKK